MVEVGVNGAVVVTGSGGNVLGDPWRALTWLANHLSGRGVGLEGGQIVTTGTVADIITVAPGDHVGADFGSLGHVAIAFADSLG